MSKAKEETRDNKKIVLIVIAVLALIGSVAIIISTVKKEKPTENFEIEGIKVTENKDMLKDTIIPTEKTIQINTERWKIKKCMSSLR